MKQFDNPADAQALALAIVDTIPEPFLVLDHELRVLAASRCFYEHFQVDPAATRGAKLYDLGDGAWDIPALRLLLETIIPQQRAMDAFEVEHDFPLLGRRTMLLTARMVRTGDATSTAILLAFKDITSHRAIEREKEALLEQTEQLLGRQTMLLSEMQHRVGNSLQIIASILSLKARSTGSEETRKELQDAHQRVMSVAAGQAHLHSSNGSERIDARTYLGALCADLASSMTGETQPIAVKVTATEGTIESSRAATLGLIVTELLINAIKYAYPVATVGAAITIDYSAEGQDWTLSVSDNGRGKSEDAQPGSGGLGTAIVAALSKQLDAAVTTSSSSAGFNVVIKSVAADSLRLKAA